MGIRTEIASATAKLSPPALVVASEKLANMALSDWVMVATLVYTVLQILFLLDRWVRSRGMKGA